MPGVIVVKVVFFFQYLIILQTISELDELALKNSIFNTIPKSLQLSRT